MLEGAASRNPGDPWLVEFIGWIYVDVGDCDLAIEHFELAQAMDPSIDSAEQGIQECGG